MEAKNELKEALIKFGTVKGRIFRLLSSVFIQESISPTPKYQIQHFQHLFQTFHTWRFGLEQNQWVKPTR